MTDSIHHPHETTSNAVRDRLVRHEPKALRTYTPTLAVLAKSAGVFHWTPEGRRLFDFTSGVLVANLGHNPRPWMKRFTEHMGWSATAESTRNGAEPGRGEGGDYFSALPLTAYNAVTPIETEASRRLVALLQARP